MPVVVVEVLILAALEEMVDLAVVELVEVQTKQMQLELPTQVVAVVDIPLELLVKLVVLVSLL
jgi:hypothetical protein|tara:strand:+ start:785 stop:973 length:189 start_codon:yes stop_codon:yes gene_type:complete